MRILENGFSVSRDSDLGVGLIQNFNRWIKDIETIQRQNGNLFTVKLIVKGEDLIVKAIPALKSVEDSRVLYMNFCNLLNRDGYWRAERLDELEAQALKGVKKIADQEGVRRVFDQLRDFLGIP